MTNLDAEIKRLRELSAEEGMDATLACDHHALKAERDKFQTWYYLAEETLCSCNLPEIVCEWHERYPGAPDAEVFTLAARADKAEAARDEAVRELQIAFHLLPAASIEAMGHIKMALVALGLKVQA